MLAGAGLDHDAFLDEDVGDVGEVLRITVPEGDMVQAAALAGAVSHAGHLVHQRADAHPRTGFGVVIQHDVLTQVEAQLVHEEVLVLGHVRAQQVDVIETTTGAIWLVVAMIYLIALPAILSSLKPQQLKSF